MYTEPRLHAPSKSPFLWPVSLIFVYGVCKQYHGTTLNPFLNGTKNGDVPSACDQVLFGNVEICYQWQSSQVLAS